MSSSTNQRVTRSSARRTNTTDAAGSASSTGSTDVSGSFTSSAAAWARPSLPVEVLTDIFKLALGPLSKPSSPVKSPISPYKPFGSLLIASRTFRALAIPYVYRFITIAQPRDWIAFFGAGRGVFVVGYDLVEKLAVLKEICLLEEVSFPLAIETKVTFSRGRFLRDKGRTPFNLLAPLDFSLAGNVMCLTVLCLRPEDSKRVIAFGWTDITALVHRLYADKAFRTQYIKELAKEDYLDNTLEEEQGHVLASLREMVEDECSKPDAQEEAIRSFLRTVRPPVIRISPRNDWDLLPGSCNKVHDDPVRIVSYEPTFERGDRSTWIGALLNLHSRTRSSFPRRTFETETQEIARLKKERKQAEAI